MTPEFLPPCKAACPVRTDAGRYARLVAEGRYDEAAKRIHDGTVGYLSIEKDLINLAKMGVVEIISIAIWEERKARELYETAISEADDNDLRKLLNSLLDMKKEHIEILSQYREKYIEEG